MSNDCKKMELPTLEYRRVHGDVIEAYKYLHGLYNVDPSDILPLHKVGGHENQRTSAEDSEEGM